MSFNISTYFNVGGGVASSSGQYIQDVFLDVSLPATNNTGFSSTVSTNPLHQYFGNDNSAKYGKKDLWVKDMVLLEDRASWLNNKPTYQIIFTENFPGVFAYAYGDVKLLNQSNGRVISINNIDDGIGITGVFRRVSFNTAPSADVTGTADILVDGADTGTDVTFGGSNPGMTGQGFRPYSLLEHANTNETNNIHDIRLVANQTQDLLVTGFAVYFENSGNNIQVFPGSVYVNKNKQTTTAGSTLALPTVSGRLGAMSVINMSSAAMAQITTQEPTNLETIGSNGGAGANITVTTGTGSSFLIGMGVVSISSGSSFQVATVTNVSTDTLTVTPATAFGVSGPLYRAWYAGGTVAINASLYVKTATFDPRTGNVLVGINGFGQSGTGNMYYSASDLEYRVWGSNISMNAYDSLLGMGFAGASGFLQVEGNFSACEIEYAGAGIWHATFGINGTISHGYNEGFTGTIKRTVFTDAGPGWNSFVCYPGASYSAVSINKINFYNFNRSQGESLGLIAEFANSVSAVNRSAINATLHAGGVYKRIYADSLYFTGDWARGTTTTVAGGVYAAGSSTNSRLKFSFYGTTFGIIGTAGATFTLSLDGASIASNLNVMIGATLGFHDVILTCQNGTTTVINAVDFMAPIQDFKNLQNYSPLVGITNTPLVFEQTNTPQTHPAGTLWGADRYTGDVWFWLFDRWNKINIVAQSDDPRADIMVGMGGS